MLEVKVTNLILKSGKANSEILKNINFIIPPNKIYTILGKNGSGKSTLIKSIANLLDDDFYVINGEILFNERNILKLNKSELQNFRNTETRYVFQDAIGSFNPLKKLEYYFKKLTKDFSEVDKLLEYFLLPEYEKISKYHSYELSGGMAQRLSFVLALLSHPKLLILDEPTSGIDAPIANLFLLKLKEFVKKGNNSVLLVTQDLFFTKEVSNNVALLSDKTLTNFLPVDDFFRNKENKKINAVLTALDKLSK